MNFNNENDINSDFGFLSDDINFSNEKDKNQEIIQDENNLNSSNSSENLESTLSNNIESSHKESIKMEDSESSLGEEVEMSNNSENIDSSLGEDLELNVEESIKMEDSESSFSEEVELLNVEEPNDSESSELSLGEDLELNVEESTNMEDSESSLGEEVEMSNNSENIDSSLGEDLELNVEESIKMEDSESSLGEEVEMSNVEFDLPQNKSSVIKVIGVGGGGSNAVNHMFSKGIKGVDFVVCNTDAQALENSQIPTKIQLGISLTEGLGAGEDPNVGKDSAIESENEIIDILKQGTKMVFITAGMGGGTGTGAAPIIAKRAKELNILTIGIVTIPFAFEGRKRREQAAIGVEKMKEHVDSLIVINNDKLIEIHGKLGFKTGFAKSDEILAVAAKGISEVITQKAQVNIDLSDARTVLKDSGTAIMGSAKASGEDRAKKAIREALDSPLLNLNSIKGAEKVLLLLISGNDEITFDEIGEINDYIQTEAGGNVDIIMGVGEDENLIEDISVTIIATGSFGSINITHEPKIIMHDLEELNDENSKKTDLNSSIRADDSETEYDSEGNMLDLDFKYKDIEKNRLNTQSIEGANDNLNSSNKTLIKKITLLEEENNNHSLINDLEEKSADNPSYISSNFNQEVVASDQIKKAQERLERLQKFNHDLKDLDEQRLNHFEKEPAYKRSGIDLDSVKKSSSENPISRFTLDEGDDELKENNSFLHDNVD